jgi:hypothetical protein
MLEILFGAGSFGGFTNHLVRHQAIFLASSGKSGCLFIIRIIAPTSLGCWVWITPTLVTCL